ncbi:pyridoxal phosphate-dependent class II aminotransferase [Aliiroseovarius crassostreae]|uniref:threonine-phosphate decarboxylase n=1 Tax=Aliiroseovarius crassostreae TaxID=154981 RepID=UPI0021FB0971|nr:threonine-phosphate decarboxylase [Aliiroseovarius crassostreae]UWP92387.1 pyridoxal phosphate-dependent class II aminotransferase [Aliiroseovarius crassostreae]
MTKLRDHGGGLDAAIAQYGGKRVDWIDLSTGINPHPYPLGEIGAEAWTALPDKGAFERLEAAARAFWNVPEGADILAAPGASALIARIPTLLGVGQAEIPTPTYNEHAAAFEANGWELADGGAAQVLVHPNNPDGRFWLDPDWSRPLTVIDESFCDVTPQMSHISRATEPGTLILKSFGKFWGLAGLRLGFVIGDRALIAKLREAVGPWQVSGPALEIGTRALLDVDWAATMRQRLAVDTARLDGTMMYHGAKLVGGTTLFRLYEVENALMWQDKLARGHVWSRVFPYSKTWLRLGLPPSGGWTQLEAAL